MTSILWLKWDYNFLIAAFRRLGLKQTANYLSFCKDFLTVPLYIALSQALLVMFSVELGSNLEGPFIGQETLSRMILNINVYKVIMIAARIIVRGNKDWSADFWSFLAMCGQTELMNALDIRKACWSDLSSLWMGGYLWFWPGNWYLCGRFDCAKQVIQTLLIRRTTETAASGSWQSSRALCNLFQWLLLLYAVWNSLWKRKEI